MNDALGCVPSWWVAFGASSLLAGAAFLRGSLSWDGALAACLVGGMIWIGFGGAGFVVLCTFFFTSTLLGRVGKSRKARFESHYAKGHRRDALQVMANGGPAFACATLGWFLACSDSGEGGRLAGPLAVAACASLASANADTWATELGVLSHTPPWHLFRWRRVPAGTSGAVSLLGCVVALSGAATVAGVAWLVGDGFGLCDAWLVAAAGFGGCLLDSALGAAAQKQYVCATCNEQVEVKEHCAKPTVAVGPGWARLGNDAVNFCANATAAAVSWLVVAQ